MSTSGTKDHLGIDAPQTAGDRVGEASLVVLPRPSGDGLQAWVRGRFVDLADPARGHAFTPTPNDLLVSAIASSLAWSARAFLALHALDDNVAVTANWSTQGTALGDVDVDLRVTVVNLSETKRDVLQAHLESAVPPHVARRQIHLVVDYRAVGRVGDGAHPQLRANCGA